MDKTSFRRAAIARRKEMQGLEVAKKSEAINVAIMGLPEYAAAGQLLAYLSHHNEVDPMVILVSAEREGKKIFAPRVVGHELEWGMINPADGAYTSSTRVGRFGNIEPLLDASKPKPMLPNDLCLVPGVLFRRDGHRLGYGGGYFDRFLATFPGVSIGLAYDWQLDDAIPLEPHDVPVDMVVTESQVLVRGHSRE